MYELFSKSHTLLNFIFIVALSVHSWVSSYILVAVCSGTLVLSWLAWIGQCLYRSIMTGETRIEIEWPEYNQDTIKDAVLLTIHSRKKLELLPGQYVYLRVYDQSEEGTEGTRLPVYSIFQSHPYFVCWWEEDSEESTEPSGKGTKITLLVEKREGLSKLLRMPESTVKGATRTSEKTQTRALIEGPFGQTVNLTSYSMMIFCATGIGIAAVLPFVRSAVEMDRSVGHSSEQLRTARKLRVYWEVSQQRETRYMPSSNYF